MRRTLWMLAACSLAACTSEARLGQWSTSPLASQDAATMRPSDPPDAPIDVPPVRSPNDGSPDGGFVHAYPLCLRNPSLDGIPYAGPIEPAVWWPADSWDTCWNEAADFPDPTMAGFQLCAVSVVNDATTVKVNGDGTAQSGVLPPPTHGVGYLMLDTLRDLPERATQEMCAPLEAGFTYNFSVDLASRVGQTHEGAVLGAGVLEIYGSNFACTNDGEPLWRSPPLSSNWQTYCVSITPAQRMTFLTLQMPAKDRPRSAILVDNIRLSQSCGPSVVAR